MKAKLMLIHGSVAVLMVGLSYHPLQAIEYPYKPYMEGKMDPQLKGWPLTEAEEKYISIEEYKRKPGHEESKHLPAMWPVTPTAGWVVHHPKMVKSIQDNKDAIDILLVGDSITQGWGGSPIDNKKFNAPWQKYFGKYKTVNIGIGGDRTEGVLWRLDHGGLEGAFPKVVVLLIGTNDVPLVTPCGVPAASVAQGIKLCVDNIREKSPKSEIVVVKILPAMKLGSAYYEDVKKVNSALDDLKIDSDAKVHVIDLWNDFTNQDGTLKTELYSDGRLHLNDAGYEIYASKLNPLMEKLLPRTQ